MDISSHIYRSIQTMVGELLPEKCVLWWPEVHHFLMLHYTKESIFRVREW